MIDVMQRLANRVYPIRFLFVVMAILCLLAFTYLVLSGDLRLDAYLFPSLISFGWSVCLFGVSDVFNKVPQKVNEHDGFFARVKKRVKRFVAWIWSVGFLVCTVMLFYLSFKAFSMAFAGA
jgi:hypothetical protein